MCRASRRQIERGVGKAKAETADQTSAQQRHKAGHHGRGELRRDDQHPRHDEQQPRADARDAGRDDEHRRSIGQHFRHAVVGMGDAAVQIDQKNRHPRSVINQLQMGTAAAQLAVGGLGLFQCGSQLIAMLSAGKGKQGEQQGQRAAAQSQAGGARGRVTIPQQPDFYAAGEQNQPG